MSLIKHKSVSSIRPLCDKVRIQSWRYHLVNLGDFNTHSFMHTQLPALHLLRPGLTEKEVGEVVWSGRTVTSEEEMGTLCGLAGVTSVPCHVPRVPSGGAPWQCWFSQSAHLSGHLLLKGAWALRCIHQCLSGQLYIPASLHLPTMQKTGIGQGTPPQHKNFSPFLFRIGYLHNSLLQEAQSLSCVITFTHFYSFSCLTNIYQAPASCQVGTECIAVSKPEVPTSWSSPSTHFSLIPNS